MYVKATKLVLAALLTLTLTATNANEFNQIVADTFTIEEYAEWLKVKQSFQARETKEKERFISCIESGTDKRLCTDSHFCLYPDNEKADICYNSVTK